MCSSLLLFAFFYQSPSLDEVAVLQQFIKGNENLQEIHELHRTLLKDQCSEMFHSETNSLVFYQKGTGSKDTLNSILLQFCGQLFQTKS